MMTVILLVNSSSGGDNGGGQQTNNPSLLFSHFNFQSFSIGLCQHNYLHNDNYPCVQYVTTNYAYLLPAWCYMLLCI